MNSPVFRSAMLSMLLCACSGAPESSARAGEPLLGLSAEQTARFHAGLAIFNHVFTPAEGLGPKANENQCSACHTDPAAGGTGEQRIVQQLPVCKEQQQPTTFSVPVIFGVGLIEAIPEKQILRHADPDDRDGDGISGRAGRDSHGHFARFGRKADVATLDDFVRRAALQEMGLTTAANADGRNPELSNAQVGLLADFIRLLAAPKRTKNDSVTAGEALFHAAHCAACHTPSMTTSSRQDPALDHKRVYLYSDLLLHDMGHGLAGTCAAGASPVEWRTAALMGLRLRQRFLHDGRARDLFSAIQMHDGEARDSRQRFERMNTIQHAQLEAFLRTL